jgi:hypothetical protein
MSSIYDLIGDRLKASEWFVAPAELAACREMVARLHYARGSANTAVYSHGLFRWDAADKMYGCLMWMPPTRPAAVSVNPANPRAVLSLSRMVVEPEVPKNACSFMLSRSIKLIKKDGRFETLVTYADFSQEHTGHVYRAANWRYIGVTKPEQRWVNAITGQQVSRRAGKMSRTPQQFADIGCVRAGYHAKHKFVYDLC